MIWLLIYLAGFVIITVFSYWWERRWPDPILTRPLTNTDIFILSLVLGIFWPISIFAVIYSINTKNGRKR